MDRTASSGLTDADVVEVVVVVVVVGVSVLDMTYPLVKKTMVCGIW